MTTIKVNTITNAAGTGAPNIPDGVTIAGTSLASVNSMDYYSQASEPATPKDGAIWWDTGNSSFNLYLDGAWTEVEYTTYVPPAAFGERGLFVGGISSGGFRYNDIRYMAIATATSTTDFGDLTNALTAAGSASDGTRGVFAGGYNGTSNLNNIDYVTIATTGNATVFGNLITAASALAGASDLTYAAFANASAIEYITVATTGNATSFGNLVFARIQPSCGGAGFGGRGLFAGGRTGTYAYTNAIDYITFATPSNASDFGDLTVSRTSGPGCTDSLGNAIFINGETSFGAVSHSYQKVNTATLGNATNLGAIGTSDTNSGVASDGTYAGILGGNSGSSYYSSISRYNLITNSSSTNIGFLSTQMTSLAGCSGD